MPKARSFFGIFRAAPQHRARRLCDIFDPADRPHCHGAIHDSIARRRAPAGALPNACSSSCTPRRVSLLQSSHRQLRFFGQIRCRCGLRATCPKNELHCWPSFIGCPKNAPFSNLVHQLPRQGGQELIFWTAVLTRVRKRARSSRGQQASQKPTTPLGKFSS